MYFVNPSNHAFMDIRAFSWIFMLVSIFFFSFFPANSQFNSCVLTSLAIVARLAFLRMCWDTMDPITS